VTVQKILLNDFFNFYNSPIEPTGSSGSPILATTGYNNTFAVGYLNPEKDCSGSIYLTGSFDHSHYFRITGSADVLSGSLFVMPLEDYPVLDVQATLTSKTPNYSISGSLWLIGSWQ